MLCGHPPPHSANGCTSDAATVTAACVCTCMCSSLVASTCTLWAASRATCTSAAQPMAATTWAALAATACLCMRSSGTRCTRTCSCPAALTGASRSAGGWAQGEGGVFGPVCACGGSWAHARHGSAAKQAVGVDGLPEPFRRKPKSIARVLCVYVKTPRRCGTSPSSRRRS
jgi:hypothetical protein